jgi:hypothetical protein
MLRLPIADYIVKIAKPIVNGGPIQCSTSLTVFQLARQLAPPPLGDINPRRAVIKLMKAISRSRAQEVFMKEKTPDDC